MSRLKTYTVTVPGTSANCGPGFDCLGLALTIYNTFSFEHKETTTHTFSFEGIGADILAAESQTNNLVLYSMKQVFEAFRIDLPYGHLHSETRIPPSRGLGSSATAIVGGVMLANNMLGHPLSKGELLLFANRIEGHPDNVCPALYGHLCCALPSGKKVVHSQIPVSPDLNFVAVVPDVSVSTEHARKVLPETIGFKYAVENVGFASLFVSAMASADMKLLQYAMKDHLHVPYRIDLIPGGAQALEVARKHGAYGATISGSGSTLIAYCGDCAQEVADAMVAEFLKEGVHAEAHILKADLEGARII